MASLLLVMHRGGFAPREPPSMRSSVLCTPPSQIDSEKLHIREHLGGDFSAGFEHAEDDIMPCSVACADDDDPCSKSLDVLCSYFCPRDSAAASEKLCEAARATAWGVAHNDCGGTTIFPGNAYAGIAYHFDADDHWLGATFFTDSVSSDAECKNYVTYYAHHCVASDQGIEMQCPDESDAGAQPHATR